MLTHEGEFNPVLATGIYVNTNLDWPRCVKFAKQIEKVNKQMETVGANAQAGR